MNIDGFSLGETHQVISRTFCSKSSNIKCFLKMFLFPLIYLCDFFENSTLNLDLSTVNQSYEWVEREIVFRPC
ncbi:hypothetical protein YC2023_057928 [Brassica napus]